MKIGFDYIATIGGGGNSRYSFNLIKSLSEIDSDNIYILYGFYHDYWRGKKDNISKNNFKFIAGYFSALNFSFFSDFARLITRFFMFFRARLHRVDVFHFTNPLNFINGISNSVVTIHDLAPIYESEWVKGDTRKWFNSNISSILSSVSMVITVSNFTKEDIIKRFNFDEKKIKVIYEAADDNFYPDKNSKYITERFGLDNYLFCAGELQPRKNIIKLLSAYSRLNPDLRRKYKLVLAGDTRNHLFFDSVVKYIDELNLKIDVVFLGRVSDDDLRKLYSCAKILICPSLFEGFGLPVAEAIKCGTPVAVSDNSSLPEVAGDAGILFNPYDADNIKMALEKILRDEDFYNVLRKNCGKQANKFNWRDTAEETLKVYKKVFEENKKPNIFLYLFIKFYLLMSSLSVARLPKIKGLFGFIYNKFKDKNGLIIVGVNNYKMYIDLSDLIISQKIIQYGYWEKGVTNLVKKIIKSNMVAVDAGAHVGYYSLLFSKYIGEKGKIFSFEPDPHNFKILKKNISLNKINNIMAENIAASDQNGYARLFLEKNNLGAHSIIVNEKSDNYINVKSVKLDDYFKETRIDLIKMDIEGAESRAMEGMSKILRNNPDIKLIMEFFPKLIMKAGHSPESLIKNILSFGFYIFIINHETGVLTETVGAREIIDLCGDGLVNLFCVKNKEFFKNYE